MKDRGAFEAEREADKEALVESRKEAEATIVSYRTEQREEEERMNERRVEMASGEATMKAESLRIAGELQRSQEAAEKVETLRAELAKERVAAGAAAEAAAEQNVRTRLTWRTCSVCFQLSIGRSKNCIQTSVYGGGV